MPLNFFNIKNNINSEDSFTLLETLIAMTILSLIVTVIFIFFTQAVTFTGRIRTFTRENKDLIVLEKSLRYAVSQIRIPFWIDVTVKTGGKNTITIPWWKGKKDSYLKITGGDEGLKITSPEGHELFHEFNIISCILLKDKEKRTVGITMILKSPRNSELLFQCAFGSIGKDVFTERVQ